MPQLKDLVCTIEHGPLERPLEEYGTTYGDGVVETFVAIPSGSRPFSVHLTSLAFIAPTVGMYVFIDGQYQGNRNRDNLTPPPANKARHKSTINLRLRQHEKHTPSEYSERFIATSFDFEKLDLGGCVQVHETDADGGRRGR